MISVSSMRAVLGAARFQTYIDASDGDAERAIRLYAWNIEASGSLWGGFHVLEVTVRNAMNTALQLHFDRPDWWTDAALTREDARAVAFALSGSLRRYPDTVDVGHVVAELSLGFWTGLVSNRYHSQLWLPALEPAFTLFHGRRADVHSALERLRRLRNRVAHHEPVFARDLSVDHNTLLKLLDALSSDARLFVESHSRLPELLRAQEATLAGTRATRF